MNPRTEGEKLMVDDPDALLKNSQPFTVSARQLRVPAFLVQQLDEDQILVALEADQKRDRAFMQAMAIVLGVIMAGLVFVTTVASLQILESLDAPAVSGFETIVRSDPSSSTVWTECGLFRKCPLSQRRKTDG